LEQAVSAAPNSGIRWSAVKGVVRETIGCEKSIIRIPPSCNGLHQLLEFGTRDRTLRLFALVAAVPAATKKNRHARCKQATKLATTFHSAMISDDEIDTIAGVFLSSIRSSRASAIAECR